MIPETRLKQNDTSPSLAATLRDGFGKAVNLTGATGVFRMRNAKTRANKISAPIAITDPPKGRVQYDWVIGDTDTIGIFEAEIVVTFGTGDVLTFPGKEFHRVVVEDDLG